MLKYSKSEEAESRLWTSGRATMLRGSTPSSSHTLMGTRYIITPSMIEAAYVRVYSPGDFQSARDRCMIQIVSFASTIYSRVCCCKVHISASVHYDELCKELMNAKVEKDQTHAPYTAFERNTWHVRHRRVPPILARRHDACRTLD